MTVNSCNVPVGRSIYTPLLTPDGGFRTDLTIMRLGEHHFRVVTGAFDGGRDKYWFTRNLPTDGSVTLHRQDVGHLHDRRVGPQGAGDDGQDRHRPAQALRRHARTGFPYGAVRDVLIDGVPCTMFRISLRRRERLGDLHQDGARSAPVGHDLGGRVRSSTSARWASASTPSPAGSRRATA